MTNISLTFLLLILLDPTRGSDHDKRRYNALKFGNRQPDYIIFKPNMEPLQTTFTVCSWVKSLRTGATVGAPCWLSYAARTSQTGAFNEILVSDNGRYNFLFDKTWDLRNSFSDITPGTWYHYCFSWNSTTGTQKVYLNGHLIRSRSLEPGLTLQTGGYLVLGNDQSSYGGGMDRYDVFGGELYKLNFFSKELSSSEVEEMSGEMCSEIEETLGDVRSIKWEKILMLPRNGYVSEIGTGCGCVRVEERCREVEGRLNTTLSLLERSEEERRSCQREMVSKGERINRTLVDLEEEQRKSEKCMTELADKNDEMIEIRAEAESVEGKILIYRADSAEKSQQLNETLQELQQVQEDNESYQYDLLKKVQELQEALRELDRTRKSNQTCWAKLGNQLFQPAETQETFREQGS